MNQSGVRTISITLAPLLLLTSLTLLVPLSSSGKTVEPIIVDTDGAVFWDDGAAVAMLLSRPDKFRIEGITLVLGNHWPYQGAEYIARVLKAMNRADIPMYIGEDHPLVNSKERMLSLEKQLIRDGSIAKTGFWKGAYNRPKEVRSLKEVEPAKGESPTGIMPHL